MVNTRAKAVWRGDNGAVHYLSSTPEGSELIVTDPAVGVERVHFDGLCRMANAGGSHMYESISASGSVLVSPTTTGLLIREYGHCMSCFMGPHDYDRWPVCPSERVRKWVNGNSGSVVRLPEPAQDSAAVSSSSDAQASGPAYLMDGYTTDRGSSIDPSVTRGDPQFTPAPVEPATPPELRWGLGPGASW